MSNKQLGMNGKLYVGAIDPASTATLTEWTEVKDVTLNLSTAQADVTTRANAGWRNNLSTLKECSVSVEALFVHGDSSMDVVKNAFLNSTELGAAVVTDALDGEGILGNFSVTDFTIGQPLEDGQSVSVTLSLSKYINWVVLGD